MIEFWAEAGPCDKSVDRAIEYAEAVHAAGAQALKVQWYNPDTLTTPIASRYDNTSGGAATQHELFANPIYPYERWEPVIERCQALGIRFIPSVFDLEAVQVANKFSLPLLKIASGDLTYHTLIRAAAEQGRQLAISTGAADLTEIAEAVDGLSPNHHILMACHLEYPTPYANANIARTFALQMSFPAFVPGFSDHTPGIDTIPLIVASGCVVIEKHFTLTPNQGYDSDFALDPDQLAAAVQKVQGTVAVMGNSDITPSQGEVAARIGARRSVYAARHIPAGQIITNEDLTVLRPFYGPEPDDLYRYLGRSFETDIPQFGELPNLNT